MSQTTDLAYPTDARNVVVATLTVSTIASLRNVLPGTAQSAIVQGSSTAGDGAGGTYAWLPSSTATDDGVTYIAANSQPAAGRWYKLTQAAAQVMPVAATQPALAQLAPTTTTGVVAAGFSSSADGGGGVWVRDASDTATATNPATVVALSDATRLKRVFSGPVDVRWAGAKGDSITADQQAIASAISASADVRYPAGTYLVSANTTLGTIASTHHHASGGILKLAAGVVLTIAGRVSAPAHQIYDLSAGGGCKVVFVHERELLPEWFGADPTGAADSTAAWTATLTSAIDSSGSGGCATIKATGRKYLFTSAFPALFSASGASLEGVVIRGSRRTTRTTDAQFVYGGSAIAGPFVRVQDTSAVRFEDCSFDFANLVDTGVSIEGDSQTSANGDTSHQVSFVGCTFARAKVDYVVLGTTSTGGGDVVNSYFRGCYFAHLGGASTTRSFVRINCPNTLLSNVVSCEFVGDTSTMAPREAFSLQYGSANAIGCLFSGTRRVCYFDTSNAVGASEPPSFRCTHFETQNVGCLLRTVANTVASSARPTVFAFGSATASNGNSFITGATNASPIVVTTAVAHSLVSGDMINIDGVTGNTAANGVNYVSVLSSTTFALYSDPGLTIAVAGNGAYSNAANTCQVVPVHCDWNIGGRGALTVRDCTVDGVAVNIGTQVDAFVKDVVRYSAINGPIVTAKSTSNTSTALNLTTVFGNWIDVAGASTARLGATAYVDKLLGRGAAGDQMIAGADKFIIADHTGASASAGAGSGYAWTVGEAGFGVYRAYHHQNAPPALPPQYSVELWNRFGVLYAHTNGGMTKCLVPDSLSTAYVDQTGNTQITKSTTASVTLLTYNGPIAGSWPANAEIEIRWMITARDTTNNTSQHWVFDTHWQTYTSATPPTLVGTAVQIAAVGSGVGSTPTFATSGTGAAVNVAQTTTATVVWTASIEYVRTH